MRQIKLIFAFAALAALSGGCSFVDSRSQASSLSAQSVELGARDTIGSILFDQRTYYLENQQFTSSVRNLRTMNYKLESPTYVYEIKTKPGNRNSVTVTATSRKPNLRSFTGVAFAVEAGKQKLTISEICETIKPSKQAPATPTAPDRPSDPIQCPAGSRSSSSVVALQ